MAQSQFHETLRVLNQYQVDFILIGGVRAVLHGAMVSTFDIDIVPSREPENLERLVQALQELKAYYRTHPSFRILPDTHKLASPEHHLLMTQFGALDILGTVTKGRDYQALLPHTVEMEVPEDGTIKVISLPMLITLKQETGREKDKLILPLLQHTLSESQREEA